MQYSLKIHLWAVQKGSGMLPNNLNAADCAWCGIERK